MSTIGIRTDLPTRLWRRVNKNAPNGCWEWGGWRHEHGYGRIRAVSTGKSKFLRTHRVSWAIHNGPVPVGMDVLHRCDNPPCCNPAHLFLGTDADNMNDMAAKGRAFNRHATKTHCPYGHPYSGVNLYLENSGKHRRCLICKRAKDRRYATQNKENTNDKNCHR